LVGQWRSAGRAGRAFCAGLTLLRRGRARFAWRCRQRNGLDRPLIEDVFRLLAGLRVGCNALPNQAERALQALRSGRPSPGDISLTLAGARDKYVSDARVVAGPASHDLEVTVNVNLGNAEPHSVRQWLLAGPAHRDALWAAAIEVLGPADREGGEGHRRLVLL